MEKNAINDEWKIRLNEAYSLGSIGGDEAINKLIKYLDDEVWQIRRAAVESLGNLGDFNAFLPLLNKIDDNAWQVRQGITFALGYIARRGIDDDLMAQARDKLNKKLKTDEEWRVRQGAASALRNFKGKSVPEALITALKDDDWHVRCTAAESLGELREILARSPIRNLLPDADPQAGRIYRKALDKIEGKTPGDEGKKPILSRNISREKLIEMKQESRGKCQLCSECRPSID